METDRRRAEFVAAASELFKEKGFSQTSVMDIAKRVGVTRSLFYHYFCDKRAIADAVIDNHADEFVANLRKWGHIQKTKGVQQALIGLVGLMRLYLHSPTSLSAYIIKEEDARLSQRFIERSSHQLTEHFINGKDRDGSMIAFCHVKHPCESFYVLCVGIIAFMLRHPNVPDETIADIIADSLHIDLNNPRSGGKS